MDELKIHIDWHNESMDVEVLSDILLDFNRINKYYSTSLDKKTKPTNLKIKEAKGGSLILTLATKSAIQTLPEILKLFVDLYGHVCKNNQKPDLAEDIINLLNKFTLNFIANGITFGLGDNQFIDFTIDILKSIKTFIDEEYNNRSSSYSCSGMVDMKYVSGKFKALTGGKWVDAKFDKSCSRQKLNKTNASYKVSADYEVCCFDNNPKYVQINKIH